MDEFAPQGDGRSPLSQVMSTSADKVERIRDIIFGAQIREYTQRFDGHARDLTRLTEAVNRLTDQLQEQERRLHTALRQESDRLLSLLQDQDKAHQQQLQALDQRLTEQLQLLDQKQTADAQRLASQLTNVEGALRTELHELSQQLNRAKVDRPAFGALLVELGNSLQNTEPAPLRFSADLLDELGKELFEG
jgi:DNA repair exonuclease SbcCD ATPase subunit